MRLDLIYGTLLGDAWIYKHTGKVKNSYTFAFSQARKEYALWKADLIGEKYIAYSRERYNKKTNKCYHSTTITIKIPNLDKEKIYNTFYKPKKIVTQEILDTLTPEAICLWYLDDGCMYYNGNNCHLTIAVDGFCYEDQILIINHFKNKYDIRFTKNKCNIYLTSRKETEKFMLLVEKYIPECMNYKILSNAIAKYKNKPKKLRKSPPGQKIIQYDLNDNYIREWNTVKEACGYYNIEIHKMYTHFAKQSKAVLGFKWKYKKEQEME